MTDAHNDVSGTVHGPVVQAGTVGQVNLTTPRPEALAGLPATPAEFAGRAAETQALLDALRPESDARVTAVAGLAGVGKTTLAVQAANRAMAEGWFPGGVLFIDLRGYDGGEPVRAEEALAAFAVALGVLSDHIPAQPAARETLYRSLLHDRPAMLVVLDNASGAAQVRPLLPNSDRHRVLVTSRHLLAELAGTRQVALDVLRPDESVELLNAALAAAHPGDDRISGQAAAADELAGLCGHLPLALSVVSALLVEDRQQPISELVADLRDNATRLGELHYGDSLTVHAAFEVSYLRLGEPEARMFRLLSLHPGRQFGSAAAAALTGLGERAAKRLLGTLRRAHMLLPGEEWGWFRFHDLVRLYATNRCESEEDRESRTDALTRLLDYYLETATAAQDKFEPEKFQSPAMKKFAGITQALSWLDSERISLVGAVLTGYELGWFAEVRDLTLVLTNFFDLRKHVDDWITTHRLAVEATRRLGDRVRESDLLRRFGNAFRHQRDYDAALGHYSRSLEIARDLGKRELEAAALNAISSIHRVHGDWDRALERCAAALALHREIDAPTASTLTNMAAIRRRQQDFAGALEHDREALRLRREIGDLRGEAQSLNNLGNTWRIQRNMAEAARLYLQAVRLHREAGDHYAEAQTLFNLGLARLGTPDVRGYWERSVELFEQCGDEREAQAMRSRLDELVAVAPRTSS